jgi:predicted dehydrogenase
MGNVHADVWSGARRGVVTAVADVSSARARDLVRRHTAGAANVFSSFDAMLFDGGVDAVDICLPHDLHGWAVIRALRANKHVLCEKPLCLSIAESQGIQVALSESNVNLVCVHNKLFAPPFEYALRLIEGGAIGKVMHAQVRELSLNLKVRTRRPPVDLIDPSATFSWRLDPQRMGGAQLIDTGWHAMYRLLALPHSRPVEVVALLSNQFLDELAGEDTAQVLVRFASGAQGSILTSWAFPPSTGAWEFEVAGRKGLLAGNGTRLLLAVNGSKPSTRTWRTRPIDTFRRAVDHFLGVVLDDRPSKAGWEEGARTLQIILGAYRSAQESRVVSLSADPKEIE